MVKFIKITKRTTLRFQWRSPKHWHFYRWNDPRDGWHGYTFGPFEIQIEGAL